MTTGGSECACRKVRGCPMCPQCEPAAYDVCRWCGQPRYAHETAERRPAACDRFELVETLEQHADRTLPGGTS